MPSFAEKKKATRHKMRVIGSVSRCSPLLLSVFNFFFNDTATTEIYTLSLHDALPISGGGYGLLLRGHGGRPSVLDWPGASGSGEVWRTGLLRAQEHSGRGGSKSLWVGDIVDRSGDLLPRACGEDAARIRATEGFRFPWPAPEQRCLVGEPDR